VEVTVRCRCSEFAVGGNRGVREPTTPRCRPRRSCVAVQVMDSPGSREVVEITDRRLPDEVTVARSSLTVTGPSAAQSRYL
jgi:hypothetical protein